MDPTKAKQIFINIPVKDLEKSQTFYEALGFTINPVFTDEDQKCLVWSDEIYVMLQTYKFTEKHVSKPRANFHNVSGPSFTLPLSNQKEVLKLIQKGTQAGGLETSPKLDEAFMTLRTIEDPDGYNWGLMYLDMQQFQPLSNPSK
jgi:predicted lactoylglutathione lyase